MSENKVAITKGWMEALARLPQNIMSKAAAFFVKFQSNPEAPGINYERIQACKDDKFFSVRIDDAYRGIVVRHQNTYLLLWVDKHDDAYAWAAKKRCILNAATNVIQVYEEVPVPVAPEAKKQTKKTTLFGKESDADLRQIGVPDEQLAFVRSLADTKALEAAQDKLPGSVYEGLTWLAEGLPVDEILETIYPARKTATAPASFAAALSSPNSQADFMVVENEEELRRIMAEPLEKWRVFLHPTQRAIVDRTYKGPARVLGGAGTGKTVVAMHRAKYLAHTLAEGQNILFTTFTANLADDILANLRKICTLEELQRIEVINLDKLASRLLKEAGFTVKIIYNNDEIDALWNEARIHGPDELGLGTDFYKEEWARVVIPHKALTLAEYTEAPRSGRGIRLNLKKRKAVWKVLEAYKNILDDRNVRDVNKAMLDCATYMENKGARYAHIIVDEAQDFGNNAFRLIRALAGEPHANDIFIAGDANQRIYRNRAVLSQCGIDVRGRSRNLRLNYRTTEETRQYAFGILKGMVADDLDDGKDKTGGCKSLTHGPAPSVKQFADRDKEIAYIIQEIQSLSKSGVRLADICVALRSKKLCDAYKELLKQANIATYQITGSKGDDRRKDGVRIATMHRVKGLEFQYMIAAAVNDHIVPPSAVTADSQDELLRTELRNAERCLLYVVITRARKAAVITTSGAPSPLLV